MPHVIAKKWLEFKGARQTCPYCQRADVPLVGGRMVRHRVPVWQTLCDSIKREPRTAADWLMAQDDAPTPFVPEPVADEPAADRIRREAQTGAAETQTRDLPPALRNQTARRPCARCGTVTPVTDGVMWEHECAAKGRT